MRGLWMLVILGSLMCGCQPQKAAESDSSKLKVLCTVGMIDDAAKSIGGDQVESVALMGPGVDPHLYKASARDAERLADADLVLSVGLHLEGKLSEILESRAERGRPGVSVGEAIPEEERRMAATGSVDPHVWHDPQRWAHAVKAIRDALIEQRPEHKQEFSDRAEAYLREMELADKEAATALSEIPESRRVLITAHDAFYYFGERYGIEVRAIQGTNTATEAGVRQISDLANFMVERRIPALFVESSVSPATIEALKKAVEAKGGRVVIPGTLYSDAMGDAGTTEGTYVGMFRHNVNLIAGALK
ncbi:MAG: zinc ABC transporter substrate-binding protein [Fimbriimonadaceae bacterium]|nr:zinc ABC transporter substrate-binding protein [Fimbriimonadaceae bacterium]